MTNAEAGTSKEPGDPWSFVSCPHCRTHAVPVHGQWLEYSAAETAKREEAYKNAQKVKKQKQRKTEDGKKKQRERRKKQVEKKKQNFSTPV